MVRFLVADAGLRQLIDIGAGLPAAENVHETAQRIDPAARVVYVDRDPVVLAYARALLAVNASTKVAEGDLLDPAAILENPVVRGHLDWKRPIGLLMSNVLHFVTDSERPAEAIATPGGRTPVRQLRVHPASSQHRARRGGPRADLRPLAAPDA